MVLILSILGFSANSFAQGTIPARKLCDYFLNGTQAVTGSQGRLVYSTHEVQPFLNTNNISHDDLLRMWSVLDRKDFTNVKRESSKGNYHYKMFYVPLRGKVLRIDSEYLSPDRDRKQKGVHRIISISEETNQQDIASFFKEVYTELRWAWLNKVVSATDLNLPLDEKRRFDLQRFLVIDRGSSLFEQRFLIHPGLLLRARHIYGLENQTIKSLLAGYSTRNPSGKGPLLIHTPSDDPKLPGTHWFLAAVGADVYKIVLSEPRVVDPYGDHRQIINIMPANLKSMIQFQDALDGDK